MKKLRNIKLQGWKFLTDLYPNYKQVMKFLLFQKIPLKTKNIPKVEFVFLPDSSQLQKPAILMQIQAFGIFINIQKRKPKNLNIKNSSLTSKLDIIRRHSVGIFI